MIPALYAALGTTATPLLRGWLKRRARRGKEDPARIGERFGHASCPRPCGRLLWLHAASVGEVQSMLALVRRLLEQEPRSHLLITTGTVTSAALVARQELPRTLHQFVPVDTPASVRRFLDHWRPDLALWVESEFWPQLLLQTHRRGIPALLLNARLSAGSFRGWQRWPRLARSILACFTAIYAGGREDAERLQKLGGAQVIEAGNLKFDAAPLTVDHATVEKFRAQVGGRPLWLAASTHGNEEVMIAQVHRTVAQQIPTLLTIIVPRHASRGDAITAMLREQGFTVAQRSKNDAVGASTPIYLADTMGELGSFYHLAPLVFLGGSLIPHGGHNPLEPARQHCAILTGPHVHNFADIMQQMETAQALQRGSDGVALAQAVSEALIQPDAMQAWAERAYGFVQGAQGATARILQHIAALRGEAA